MDTVSSASRPANRAILAPEGQEDYRIGKREALIARSIMGYTATVTLAVGLSLMLVWLFQSGSLHDNIPQLYQSKFNTVFGITLCGFTIGALLFEKPKWAAATMTFVTVMALLLLSQHVFGISLGIDQLVVRDYLSTSPFPGRSSVNSITCMLLVSAVVFLTLAPEKVHLLRLGIVPLFVLYVICLSALGGYFSDVPLVYTWGSYAQISPQTAFSFLTVSMGLSAYIWLNYPRHVSRMPFLLPAFYTLLVFWFDLSTPLGVSASIAYIPLVFFGLGYRSPAAVFLLAGLATVLTVAGYFLSPPAITPEWVVMLNRAMSIGAVWFTALVVFVGRSESIAREDGERHMRAVVNTVLDGLIAIDEYGTIQRFNPAAQKMFGYGADEVVGRNVKMLMPDPYHSEHDTYLHNYRTSGTRRIIDIGREVEARRKNGTSFPIELGVGETTISGKRLFVGTIRDISRRRESEREIVEFVAALQRSNQDLDDFAYIASHDLKEPLRGLANNARFLEEDYAEKLEGSGKKRIARIMFLCHRMEQLVDDLLYFSRLGRQEQAVQDGDPNTMVADVVAMMESWLQENNAKVVMPKPMPVIRCDVPRITEVLRNLITNGVKYNDKPEKIVEVGSFTRDGERVFYVKDNGIGIAEEFHEEIFRIFKRLNTEDDNAKGSGVGLTFVRKIVERHNGHIWIESSPGEGSTFLFTLNKPVPH